MLQYRGGSLYHNPLTNLSLLLITSTPPRFSSAPRMILLILQHPSPASSSIWVCLSAESVDIPIHRTAVANQISRICKPSFLMVSGISFQSCLSAIGQIPDGGSPDVLCISSPSVPASAVFVSRIRDEAPTSHVYWRRVYVVVWICISSKSFFFISRTQLQSFVRAVFTIFKLTSEKWAVPDGRRCVVKVYKSPHEPYGRPVMVEFEKESLVRTIVRRLVNTCVVLSHTGGFRTLWDYSKHEMLG